MTSSLREAMELAKQRQQSEQSLTDEVTSSTDPQVARLAQEWSADDAVHVDPPLPPQPTEPPAPVSQENAMFTAPKPDNGVTAATPAPAPAPAPNGPPMKKKGPFMVTDGVTEATFNYVRDHQGITGIKRTDVVKRLAAKGYKANSVSSLIGQMVVQRLIFQDAEGRLRTGLREYVPLKSGAAREALVALARAEAERGKDKASYARVGLARSRVAKAVHRERMITTAAKALGVNAKTPLPTPVRGRPPTKGKGVDIDAAHRKAAKQVLTGVGKTRIAAPKTAEKVRQVVDSVERRSDPTTPVQQGVAQQSVGSTLPNLRGYTAETIVEAMNLVQAKGVFKKLHEFFNDEQLQR